MLFLDGERPLAARQREAARRFWGRLLERADLECGSREEVEIALGIATLLLAVPVGFGAAHQGGAMVVLGLLLWLNHELRVARVPGDSA